MKEALKKIGMVILPILAFISITYLDGVTTLIKNNALIFAILTIGGIVWIIYDG